MLGLVVIQLSGGAIMFVAHFAGCDASASCRCEERRYELAFLVTVTLFLLEAVGGYWTNSLSLASDAVHLFTDILIFLVALLVQNIVRRKLREERKIRAWGGVFSAGLLLLVLGILFREVVRRLFVPEEVLSVPMVFVAIFGLGGNGFALALMRAGEENHRTHRSVVVHIATDTLLSLLVIIGGLATYLTGIRVLDPVVSLFGVGFIGRWCLQLLKDSLRDLR